MKKTIIKQLIILSLFTSDVMIALSTTLLNTAGPVITSELGGLNLYSWLFTTYMLFTSITIPLFGKLCDIIGRKSVFVLGLTLFIFASLIAGLSGNIYIVILARAVQGIGAGAISPSSATLIGDMFDIKVRGKIQGYFSMVWGLMAFLGPVIGSIITEYLDWRWLFFVNVPVGLLTIGLISLYKEKEIKKSDKKLDLSGVILFSLSIFTLLFGTIKMNWLPIFAILSAICFFLFFKWNNKKEDPFLPIHILKDKNLLIFNLNTFLFFFSLFGLESFIPLYTQNMQGASVLLSGIVLSGISLGWIISSYPSGIIIYKFGYKKPIMAGNTLLLISTTFFIFYNDQTSYYLTFFILFLHGISYGLNQTVSTIGSYELAEKENKGLATSLQSFSRNIGTALSLAAMGYFYALKPNYMFTFSFIMTTISFLVIVLVYYLFKNEIKAK